MKKRNLFELHEQVFLHPDNKQYYIKFVRRTHRSVFEKRIYYVWAKKYLPVSDDHIEKRFIDANYDNLLSNPDECDLDYIVLEYIMKKHPKYNSTYLFATYIDRIPSLAGISRYKFLRLSAIIRRENNLPRMPVKHAISEHVNIVTPWDSPKKRVTNASNCRYKGKKARKIYRTPRN